MDSVKTKSKKYTIVAGKAIGQVVLVPENGKFRIYVAWEWEEMAKDGWFAIMKSDKLFEIIDSDAISHACNYGDDVTNSAVAKKLFYNLF